jgi:protein gp37
MNKTKIEWADYTINPVKGLCPVDCRDNSGKPYCYARRMYKRFKWNPEIRLEVDSFLPFLTTIRIKPSKIFVGSTIELFGDWIKPEWMDFIFKRVKLLPEHTFIFLTKQPQNLVKWSPFPDNCWVGVSATNDAMMVNAVKSLKHIKATVKFISFEPLLERVETAWMNTFMADAGVNWIICGQQTPVTPSTLPRLEWIKEIVQAADMAGIPVFLKDNLLELVNYEKPDTAFAFNEKLKDTNRYYRQEFPKL